MKKIAIALAVPAMFALGACAEEAAEESETTIVETEEPAPTMTETTVVDPQAESDSLTVDEDGVSADINDGDTSVEADLDEDPSATVNVD